jgi:hypothetical protein
MAGTDASAGGRPAAARTGRQRPATGIDRLTVGLFSLTAFLLVLALLATQIPAGAATPRHPVVVVRTIYETTVVETVTGASAAPETPAVTQSVSSTSSGESAAAAPITRSS